MSLVLPEPTTQLLEVFPVCLRLLPEPTTQLLKCPVFPVCLRALPEPNTQLLEVFLVCFRPSPHISLFVAVCVLSPH